ncbi:hypothetical protein GN109_01670 [Collimonas pratensis]|uniref:hypothetical protein n=1 Tax=Collimonas pratensis TaxID=279113 RepID=UPI00143D13F4|nr:hypothetical protein [Collimonas pratensis]NKI68114.1 hypothetical protein [Collimonas pratensis]
MKILMHASLFLLLICAYVGIGCLIFLPIKRSNTRWRGLMTTGLSAVILAALMTGLLLGAFHE